MGIDAGHLGASAVAVTLWLLGFGADTITDGALHIPTGAWMLWGLVGALIAALGTVGRVTDGWRRALLVLGASGMATVLLVTNLFAAQWVVLGGVFTGLAVLSFALGRHPTGRLGRAAPS